MSNDVHRRFNEEWLRLIREQGWSAATADHMMQTIRTPGRKGPAVEVRATLAARMRNPLRGAVISYPDIASVVGYSSHTGAMYAAKRRGVMPSDEMVHGRAAVIATTGDDE